jgi:F0F1-type ATP synthase membrane subunit b/b'
MSQARLEFKKSHPKSTVADIDALIMLDPRVQEVQQQLLDAEESHEDLESILYSLRQRHENIKELCANIRKEMTD